MPGCLAWRTEFAFYLDFVLGVVLRGDSVLCFEITDLPGTGDVQTTRPLDIRTHDWKAVGEFPYLLQGMAKSRKGIAPVRPTRNEEPKQKLLVRQIGRAGIGVMVLPSLESRTVSRSLWRP